MSTTSGSGPHPWLKLGQTTQCRTRIFDLEQVRFRHPSRGTEKDFVVLRAPDWVNVVAVTPDEHLVLVTQFRYGSEAMSLEIPGGIMDAGEDPVAAGLRELREETGYAGKRARLLGSVHPNPAIQSNRAHFVLVEEATCDHPLGWDEDEELALRLEPVESALAMARSGGITHALVLNGLMLFEAYWRERRR